MTENSKYRYLIMGCHFAAWTIVFCLPLFFLRKMVHAGWEVNYFDFFFMPLSFVFAFYLNYALLIPYFLFKNKIRTFLLIDVFVLASLTFSIDAVHSHFFRPFCPPHCEMQEPVNGSRLDVEKNGNKSPEYGESHRHRFFGRYRHGFGGPRKDFVPMAHDCLSLLLVMCISVLLRYTLRWFQSKEERKELERTKMEMELKNLKSQLNPHFLFNTLNNIYALIGISQEKAQQSVIDLSKLLRYVLYDSKDPYVPLSKEVDFIENYIKLMQLRLADSVKINVDIDIAEKEDLPVVQLLFISLVENAFKHGVSLEHPSSIDIKLEVNEKNQICFIIKNSYFPKPKKDKSGSGIGLENLRRRLELLYPNKYIFQTSVSDGFYVSTLILDTK